MILACAIAASVNYLVSREQRFAVARRVRGHKDGDTRDLFGRVAESKGGLKSSWPRPVEAVRLYGRARAFRHSELLGESFLVVELNGKP